MHGAPPVHITCGPDRAWVLGVRGLGLVAAVVSSGWVGAALGLPPAATVLLALLTGASAWWASSSGAGPMSLRQLDWDGQRWTLQGVPGEVDVMLDFGGWLLLRFRSAQATQWVALSLRRCGAPPALCRAVLLARPRLPAEGGHQAR